MKNVYEKWDQQTNPAATIFTNTYVNYFAGVNVVQTAPSGILALPSSYEGKKFQISNETTSTFDVTVQINTTSGTASYDIDPGDSAIFVYVGGGIWDQTGGEGVIKDIASSAVSGTNSFRRVINFNDAPDTAPARYNIGTVATGFTVDSVAIDITPTFDDAVADTLIVEIGGTTIIMPSTDSDIKQAGTFVSNHNDGVNPLDGDVEAYFNSVPNGSGGSQGIAVVTITVKPV